MRKNRILLFICQNSVQKISNFFIFSHLQSVIFFTLLYLCIKNISSLLNYNIVNKKNFETPCIRLRTHIHVYYRLEFECVHISYVWKNCKHNILLGSSQLMTNPLLSSSVVISSLRGFTVYVQICYTNFF